MDPDKTPVYAAPPGQISNLIDPPSQAWQPRVSIYTTLPLVLVSISLRVYARHKLAHGFQADDFHDNMYGRHFWDMPVSAVTPKTYMISSAVTAIYASAAMLTKIALCLLYRRMFYASRQSSAMLWSGVVFTAVSYLVCMGVWVAYTVPHPGEDWLSTPTALRAAQSSPVIGVTLGCLSTFTDFYILIIPVATVARLNMNNKKKIALSGLFLTGLLACSLSAAGIASRLDNYHSILNQGIIDPYWLSTPAYALAMAEVNLGITCACLPVIFPLCKRWLAQSRAGFSSFNQSNLLAAPTSNEIVVESPQGKPSQGHWKLPQIPRSTYSGIRTAVRGRRGMPTYGMGVVRREGGIQTIGVGLDMMAYTELQSVEVEYHRHLRTGIAGHGWYDSAIGKT
ncbi:hypothetical protein B0I35DRAFT_349229 [Stachybotrys elegans]|uniref:Rhodopsin domain-containing protein n=1 Tax=Stachybotrys elegans TaxID=80388 RepID=A0A8K0T1F8_9HYPO|nr:hypothetical protein B0I35DRAFT_349229 [Stachybotrys elegans]